MNRRWTLSLALSATLLLAGFARTVWGPWERPAVTEPTALTQQLDSLQATLAGMDSALGQIHEPKPWDLRDSLRVALRRARNDTTNVEE